MNNPFLNQSVSHATLRSEDLLFRFANVLNILNLNSAQPQTKLHALVLEAKTQAEILESGCAEDSDYELASTIINEDLMDALQDFAPQGYYFGTLEGDASDFGFWQCQNEEAEFVEDEPNEYESNPHITE